MEVVLGPEVVVLVVQLEGVELAVHLEVVELESLFVVLVLLV